MKLARCAAVSALYVHTAGILTTSISTTPTYCFPWITRQCLITSYDPHIKSTGDYDSYWSRMAWNLGVLILQLFRAAVVASGFSQVLISPRHDSPRQTGQQLRGPKRAGVPEPPALLSQRVGQTVSLRAHKVWLNCIQKIWRLKIFDVSRRF